MNRSIREMAWVAADLPGFCLLRVEVNLRRPPDAVYAGVQVKPDGEQMREKRFDWLWPGTSISDAPTRWLWRKDFSRKSIGMRVCSCQGGAGTSSTFDWTPDSRGTGEFQHNTEPILGSLFGGLKNAGKRRLAWAPSGVRLRSQFWRARIRTFIGGVATETRSLSGAPFSPCASLTWRSLRLYASQMESRTPGTKGAQA